jgi:hypothetical protein
MVDQNWRKSIIYIEGTDVDGKRQLIAMQRVTANTSTALW